MFSLDNQAPNVACPADIMSTTTVVTFMPTVTDNADPSPDVTYYPLGPGDDFPDNNVTVVNVTVTDASGNTASCSFNVTVEGKYFDNYNVRNILSIKMKWCPGNKGPTTNFLLNYEKLCWTHLNGKLKQMPRPALK